MMVQWYKLVVLALVFCCYDGLQAQGQGPINPVRPTTSPYLNLLREDSTPLYNYYGLVRPQQAANRQLNALNNQTQALAQTFTNNAGSMQNYSNNVALTQTGMVAGFLNHNGYFMNSGGYASGSINSGLAGGIGNRIGSRFNGIGNGLNNLSVGGGVGYGNLSGVGNLNLGNPLR